MKRNIARQTEESNSLRLAIVVPRYGAALVGGAARQARGFTAAAAARGWTVEVWTTCARSHYDWRNDLPPGRRVDNGVPVVRFPITQRPQADFVRLEQRLAAGGELAPDDQYRWLETGAHSAPLYEHVSREAGNFDFVITLPYAQPMVHYVAAAAPERAILWPCLHDEPYAYLQPTRQLLESAWAIMFNSPEEQMLAVDRLEILPQRQAVLGEGVTLAKPTGLTAGLPRDLLYVGRLEAGKNLQTLYDYVQRLWNSGARVRLTVVGLGPLTPPEHPAFDFRGFLSDGLKAAAYQGSLALVQPSLNESFSLTIMESWLAERPVLVNGECTVTHGHVRRARGGLWYFGYDEFVGATAWLRAHPDEATRMGENGREYVRRNYTWSAVLNRFEAIVERWRRPVA